MAPGTVMRATALVIVLLACCHVALATTRPIVGLLTQPLSDNNPSEILVASYVKWIESSGARVAPIRFTASETELLLLLSQVNGLLLPGGLNSIVNTTFAQSALTLLQAAIGLNEKGDYFPVWGTCMGFEQLMVYESATPSNPTGVLSSVDGENVFLPVQFVPGALTTSRLFSGAPTAVLDALSTENITINMHIWGVLPSTFDTDPVAAPLRENFNVLATSVDPNGTEFIAIVEHKKFPIYGVQFHPEKNAYEWAQGAPDVTHTADAVQAMQFLAAQFMADVRQNNHQFVSPDAEQASLIYNYAPVFTGVNNHVEQTYYFSNFTSIARSHHRHPHSPHATPAAPTSSV